MKEKASFSLAVHGNPSNKARPTSPNKRKRKSAGRTHSTDGNDSRASESEPEDDDIRLFRRVHVKPRTNRNDIQWSIFNKHPSLNLDGSGRNISLVEDLEWPAGLNAVAVYANRDFHGDFCYYEITVVSGGDSDGYECQPLHCTDLMGRILGLSESAQAVVDVFMQCLAWYLIRGASIRMMEICSIVCI